MFNESVYNKYSAYLKGKYGEKVYKLPVNIPVSCPNRDNGCFGCTYCDDKGAGFENLSDTILVGEQLRSNMAYIGKKYKANKFIGYFQNFTNTYLPLSKFKEYIFQAANEDIVEIAVSTRPDCIRKEYLEVLKEVELEKGIDITIELGLQSTNFRTLEKINRGHTLGEYIDAVLQIKSYGFKICTHMILNLPWDTKEDAIEGAKIISALGIDFVKLHGLYIVEGTKIAEEFLSGDFEICSVEEYKARVISFLRHLSPNIYMQRLIGRAPKEGTLFANWNTSWWKIHDEIETEMKEKGFSQGDLFNYLGGEKVKKFID